MSDASQEEVRHREEEYPSEWFDVLFRMQEKHFWYQGRHRFLLHALKKWTRSSPDREERSAIDLGGGCGGWIAYLRKRAPGMFAELALADSSSKALAHAERSVGADVERIQVDLRNLPWRNRWDVAFLLDVLEHIPDHVEVMRQVYAALRPGGRLFVTAPAFQFFWSYNDALANHVRRYRRKDLAALADESGFTLLDSRYFMFFLSPLLYLSRLRSPNVDRMTPEEVLEHQRRSHRVPASPINAALKFVFCSETPLGFHCPFPWGTSILGVFQKPR